MKKLLQLQLVCTILLVGFNVQTFAQKITVNGIVTDHETNIALPGVNVVIKNTQTGTITSANGEYSIAADNADVLLFSFIGYKTAEIQVNGQNTINVKLVSETIGVDEVVVIGYGSVKKTDATGSVTSVTTKDFNRGAITSPQDLIAGKTSGVQITATGGAPGAGSTIRIRGGASLSANNEPLIIIDGVPVDNDGISGMRNPLSTVNPNDIESFTVLKDASATAIYGSRASNGVIIITTKKGQSSNVKFSYNGNTSVGFKANEYSVMSAGDYRQALTNRYGESSKAVALLGDANTNWQNEIFKPAFGHDHNISAAGGAGKLPFRASVGYSNQNGMLITSEMERVTGAININPSLLDKHLTIDLNIKAMYNKNRFAGTSAISNAILYDPTKPVTNNSDYGGYTTWLDGPVPNSQATTNPVAYLNQRDDRSTVMRAIGNVKIDYKMHFLPDLKATLNLGFDKSGTDGYVFVPENAAFEYRTASDGTNNSGIDNVYTQKKLSKLIESYLTYSKEIESIMSKFDVMGGYSYQSFWRDDYSKSTSVNGQYVISPENSNPTENLLISFYGRLNYALLNRYLLTFTLRDDGTSRFSPDNRWGLFPSAAIAWRLNQESFLSNALWLSELKLRVGYGVTGQQYLTSDNYPYLARYSYSMETAQYLFGNQWYTMLRPSGYNSNLKWEETNTFNMGVDYGFFDNRVNGSFELYQRDTKDLINEVPVAAGTNFTNLLLTNIGNMRNRGVEFNVNYRAVSTEKLFCEFGANLTLNQNEITKLTMVDNPDYQGAVLGRISSGTGYYAKINSVGYPANSYFVYQQVYWPNGKPVEGVYVDRNDDGVVNEKDKYHFHSSAPDVLLGISARVNYQNFDFAFTGRASFGNYVYNDIEAGNSNYQYVYNTTYVQNIPTSISNTNFNKQQLLSDYYVQKASFFKMDNISVGYSFDKLYNDKIDLRLSLTVQNLFVITPYQGLDPEVFDGIDNNIYPRPRSFIFGVSLNF